MGPTPKNSLKVIAHIHAKAGKREVLKEALLALINPTRNEDACLEYELFEDMNDLDAFTFVETWTDESALEQHLQTPHLQGFLSKAAELLYGEPQILRLRLLK